MNEIDYLKKVAADKEWFENNTFYLNPDEIEYSTHEDGNECRVTIQSSDLELRAQIEQHGGNWVPITVHGGPGNWCLDDGHNRLREILNLGLDRVLCYQEEYNSPEDRMWSMLLDNVRPKTNPATSDDIVNVLVRSIKENYSLGSDFSKITDFDVRARLTVRFQKVGRPLPHGNVVNNIVKKVLAELDSGVKQYKNYAKKEDAAKKFSEINPWGLDVSESGAISIDQEGQEWAVYFAGTRTWVGQNGVHGAFHMKTNRAKVKVLLVCYDEKIHNNKGNLKEFREAQKKKAESVNSSPILMCKLYDRYAVLPQVLKGKDAEDHNKLVTWGNL